MVALCGIFSLLLIAGAVVGGYLYMKRTREILPGAPPLDPARPAGDSPQVHHLQSVERLAWTDPRTAERIITELKGLGFMPDGRFSMEGLAPTLVAAFVHPDQGVSAALKEMKPVGIWTEIIGTFEDGATFAASTAQPTSTAQMDRHTTEYFLGYGVTELWEKFKRKRPARELRTVEPGGFAAFHEQREREIHEWRALRGGFSDDEIRVRVGANASADDFAVAKMRARQQNLDSVREILIRSFLETNTVTASVWEEVREDVVVVYDLLEASEIRQVVAERLGSEMNLYDGTDVGFMSAREAFSALNNGIGTHPPYRLLGEVRKPIGADFYIWNR